MNKSGKMILMLAAILITRSFSMATQTQQKAEVALKNAMEKETVDGDLKSAIDQYQKITKMPGASRAVVAKALFQLGNCYEKQGDAEARKTFERVLKDYGDQTEIVGQARVRLSLLGFTSLASTQNKGLSIHRLEIDGRSFESPGPPSPDGRYLAYIDNAEDLAIYDLSANTSRKLTNRDAKGNELAMSPFWSRDGNMLAFEWYNKDGYWDLRIFDLKAMSQQIVYSTKGSRPETIGWFPDGRSLLVDLRTKDSSQLVRLSTGSGSPQFLRSQVPGFRHILSPDGRYIVYVSMQDPNQVSDLFLLPVDGGSEVRLSTEKSRMRLFGWDPDGRSVLFTSDRSGAIDLWRIGIADGKAQGEAVLAKAGIGNIWPLGLTRQGSLFYQVPNSRPTNVFVSAFDFATGKLAGPAFRINSTHVGSSTGPQWSPDGTRLAYLAATTQAEQAGRYTTLCIWSEKSGTQKEFVLDKPLLYWKTSWSPDGQFLFGIDSERRSGVLWQTLYRVDSRTGEISVAAAVQGGYIFGWSPDAKTVYANKIDAATQANILVAHDVQAGNDTEIYRVSKPSTLESINQPHSPDGKWIVFRESRRLDQQPPVPQQKLIAIPAGGGPARELVTCPGILAWWMPDGKRLLYYVANIKNVELWEISIQGGSPRRLDQSEAYLSYPSCHPDGKRIAYVSFDVPIDEGIYKIENPPPLKAPAK
jgi:Tol biopolymer transport system component